MGVVSADVYFSSNMGLVCGSACLEACTFSPGIGCHRLCHDDYMAFSADCAPSVWTYPARPSKRHRMGDRASDDC